MAEIQLQLGEQKTLKALSGTTEAVRASDLTEDIGERALNVGNSFRELAKGNLAELVDKRKKLWQITSTGKEIAASIQLPQSPPPVPTPAPTLVATPVPPPVPPPVPSSVPTPAPAPAQTTTKTPAEQTGSGVVEATGSVGAPGGRLYLPCQSCHCVSRVIVSLCQCQVI